jgi:hypothetical protein
MVLLFMGSQQSDSDRAARTRALKDLVRSQFKLGDDDGVFVAEIACGETDCPDVETVIAIFISGQRREFKVRKPIGAITAQDLAELSGSLVPAIGESDS